MEEMSLETDHDPSFWLPADFLTDDDDLLAELTRHDTRYNNPTEKQPWLFSTSPQSTLSGFGRWSNRSGFTSNGSPNGPSSRVPSPPVTPPLAQNDAAWDLLYEAAGQVARLKINAIAAAQSHQNRAAFLDARRNPNPSLPAKSTGFYDFPNTNQFHCPHHHHPRRSSGGGALGLPQSAWPPLGGTAYTHPRHHGGPSQESGMRAMFLGGDTSVKRQSAGTGVFLPRRPISQAEPRRKPACGSPVLIPARVAQALNINLDEINTGADLMRSRRSSFAEHQRRNGGPTMAGNNGVSLPIDWTY